MSGEQPTVLGAQRLRGSSLLSQLLIGSLANVELCLNWCAYKI